eukprot:TRINITY_DN10266_c0_g1_i1.p2 TRINITY_DN10266_c0_g1~~TRINITY_DN10266_c0_g1_i1.p2  ORF type:complete len:113 (+),score=28.54 TRINITY_DN10266_c0_g1_i1:2-340(+)
MSAGHREKAREETIKVVMEAAKKMEEDAKAAEAELQAAVKAPPPPVAGLMMEGGKRTAQLPFIIRPLMSKPPQLCALSPAYRFRPALTSSRISWNGASWYTPLPPPFLLDNQ